MLDSSILAEAFLAAYISVIKLDLRTGEGLVLKSELVSSITLERLKKFCQDGKGNLPIEVRITSGGKHLIFQWMEITAVAAGKDRNTILVTMRNIEEEKLIKKILDVFVYQNYDYLLLIDSNTESYTRFTGNKGNTPIPQEKGAHYTEDMIRYNQMYVVPEDCDRVTACMQLDYVRRLSYS